ncbi:MAG: plasmid stabilization protein [Cytophagales bacterium CG12_big_fil_rev_8_21_14_0_65_40_12]|nr:MAG: plasmid stabilization protein [Cytophagales bacterium CG12_big_fil_rev_8_21_14_0_65_40_12]PIW04011.1 MAG: plasmid stabilization protein [Cytophagales bacterium CG17_big_fil_post_rev_8_21_14_2_50_40_13]
MKIVYLKKFSKDLDKIANPKQLKIILDLIRLIENAENIQQIPSIKKLSGFTDAYRIRVGDFRIGVFLGDDTIEFARIAHRKDIYKLFP